jgi:hypothetical protein
MDTPKLKVVTDNLYSEEALPVGVDPLEKQVRQEAWLREIFFYASLGIFVLSSLILLIFETGFDRTIVLLGSTAGWFIGAVVVLAVAWRRDSFSKAAVFAAAGVLPILTVYAIPEFISIKSIFGSSLFFLAVFGLISSNVAGMSFWKKTFNTAVGGVVSMLFAIGLGTVLHSFLHLYQP